MFIDICGIDGCGKSTIARALQSCFLNKGIVCEVFHGYKPGQNINLLRDVCIKAGIEEVHASFLNSLGMAAKLMDIYNNMHMYKNDLNNDSKVVISEKYIKDSVIFMPLLGGSYALAKMYENNLPKPDYRFILDIDAQIARNRIENRSSLTGEFIHQKESLDILLKARENFLQFTIEPNTFLINANRPICDIVKDIMSKINIIGNTVVAEET